MGKNKKKLYDNKILFCCTTEMKNDAEKKASEKGLDVSSYIRVLIKNDK